MEDEQRGEMRDSVIHRDLEGEGRTGCAVCDKDSKGGRERGSV